MIRRAVGKEFWLIAQDDHARVAGELAAQVGNAHFSPPSSESVTLAVSMHDSGWPIHDDQPTLNPRGLPLDVFETPPVIGLRVWEASVRRAAGRDPYAGLLVSLHVLALSAFATGPSPLAGRLWNLAEPRIRFDVNRFQHAMIEFQESGRQKLGLRNDLPLKHGLAESSTDPAELRLKQDFRLLQGMDMLSLSCCCTRAPFTLIEPIAVKVARVSEQFLKLDPWPFKSDRIEVRIPYRRVKSEPFADEAAFRAAYSSATVERFTVSIEPHTI